MSDVPTETAQKLANLFDFWKGEWWADQRQGVPYMTYVYGIKNPDLRLISNMVEKILLSAPGVAAVLQISVDLVPATRALSISFTVTTNDGSTITGGPGLPFIVTPQPQDGSN